MEKIIRTVGLVAILAVTVMVTLWVARKIDNVGQIQYEQFLQDTIQHFEQHIAESGELIVSQKVQIGTLEDALKSKIIEAETLKKANIDKASLIVSLKSEIELLNVQLDYVPDEIYVYDTIIQNDDTYLKVPMPFQSRASEWVFISGIVQSQGVALDSVNIQQNPTFGLGYRDRGFFRSPTPVVYYTDKNPYINPIEMQNVQVIQKVPWHKTPTTHRIEGTIFGIALVKFAQWLSK